MEGSKWWAYLPKDFYEAKEEWTCNPECSQLEEVDLRNSGIWLYNMLPQLRFKNESDSTDHKAANQI